MQDVIKTAIQDVLTKLDIAVNFVVEHPAERTHGDYASNVALRLHSSLLSDDFDRKTRKNSLVKYNFINDEGEWSFSKPRELAEKIVAALDGKVKYVDTIEVAGPGFINFKLSRDFFVKEVSRVLQMGADWGRNDSWSGKKVIVEYTDPNPFKEFHIGHLFTNSAGESIARLFIVAGADTKRVNYQGDVGIHVACALYGMQKLGFAGTRDFTARELGKAYALGAKTYREDETAKGRINAINKAVYERSDDVINTLYDKGREVSLAYFETIYEILGTRFDHYFFESEAAPQGKELVLAHPDIFPESDLPAPNGTRQAGGARVFRGEEYGLHTRVFLNSEELPTYEAKELALAKLKEKRLGAYDHSVIVTANEISEYFKVLFKAMSFVYPELAEKTEHIGHGTVRLKSGKMSSRSGEVITALDFIEEVAHRAEEKMRGSGVAEVTKELARDIAIGAIKYATLKSSIFQDTVFDPEQALSFEGDSGPYLMYTHARIASLLRKAKDEGVNADMAHAPDEPYDVEVLLYRFPEAVLKALDEREPHHVAVFLIELAGAFNTFYAKEKIVDPNDEYAPYKVALADAVRQTLKNGLWTLGIKAPEQM